MDETHEDSNPIFETVLELEQEVTCGICHDHFQEPKLLPCCHYYCKQCILDISKRYKPNQPFPCPDCREPTLLPGNDPDGLPTAFFINRMKELHSRMEKAHGKLEAPCEMCSGGKTVAFCRQCAHFICEECVKSHERMKVFTGHVICTLDELKQGGAKELSLDDTPPQKCEVHEEPKKIFCFDCNQLICRDCVLVDHGTHKYEFVKKAAIGTRQELAESLSPLKNVASELSQSLEKVKNVKLAVEENGSSASREITSSFQELYDILEQRKQQLLETTSTKVKLKLEYLSAQEKDTDIALSGVNSLVNQIEKNVKRASDEEVVVLKNQIQLRVNAELEKHHKDRSDVEPVEEPDIGVEVSMVANLRDLCGTKAKVFQMKVDPSNCTTKGDGTSSAEINKVAKFTLFANLPNRAPTRKSINVEAELESLVDGSVVRVSGVHSKGNSYSIEYTPRIRGRHYLVVTVDDQPIVGSPFSVFVTIPPTKLDKPVRVIDKGVSYPKFLAFTSSEQLIVTEGGDDVSILTKKGEKIQTISQSEHGFTDGAGVAVDQKDNIYLTDGCYNGFYKFDKSGALLKVFGEDVSILNSPRGLTVVGDHVMVCDSWNHRVQVFSTELEQIRKIGSGGSGDGQFKNPKDVAIDRRNDTLYVTDGSNHRVQVFTTSGDFVRSFGKKGNDSGELSFPLGVCLRNDYIYVVENGNNRVSVFCTNGEFVCVVGKDQFKSPYGIAVDIDGFVYVSDCGSGKVKVF